MFPTFTPQPVPTMSFFPSHLDSPPSSRGRRAVVRLLMAAATATGFLGLGSVVQPLEAQAHSNPCVTLKGTAFTKLTRMVDSEGALRWQCLRIIKNDSLETIDLSKLTGLTYLEIKDNKNLKDIKFPSSLKYLYIKDNDNDELKSLNLSNLTRLTHLRIENNNCLSSITFPNLSNLKYIHIINNNQLKEVMLNNLARLTCLHIKDNEILESIFAPNLVDLYCIKISNNSSLESINFSKLINVTHLKIEDNKKLTTIKTPSHFLGTGPP